MGQPVGEAAALVEVVMIALRRCSLTASWNESMSTDSLTAR